MALPEELLQPISDDAPCGKNLYYEPVFDEIREARRQEPDDPQGLWEHDRKTADFKTVQKLATKLLQKETKDLQVAAWLTEAWIYERGCEGLLDGLALCKAYIETFWDHLYPELEEGDAEFRATPLEWLGNYFAPEKGTSPALGVRYFGLDRAGHSYLDVQESRSLPTEEGAGSDKEKVAARKKAAEAGKLLPEVFEEEFGKTPKAFYKELYEQVSQAQEDLRALDDLCTEKFADVAPSFSALRDALEEVKTEVHVLLQKKRELEPDLEEEEGQPEEEGEEGEELEGRVRVVVPQVSEFSAEELKALEPGDKNDAVKRIVAIARYLRRIEPQSPVAYLLLRALRWGELRVHAELASGSLDAPSTEARTALKQQAAASQWQQVLETAEMTMGGTCGRGWLDLHRYSIRACDELGHGSVSRALRSELKCLLADYPDLPNHTMKDDTGTANPETIAWFNEDLMGEPEG